MNFLLRKTRSFLNKSWFERLWLLPAWVLLGFSRLAIIVFSFKRLAPLLGEHFGNTAWLPLLNPEEERRALLIGRTVRMAANYTPWNSNCFPQAVTARLMLGLFGIPYALFFGLSRDPQATEPSMRAHAWVASGRIRVTGGYSFSQFTVVGSFISPRLGHPGQALC